MRTFLLRLSLVAMLGAMVACQKTTLDQNVQPEELTSSIAAVVPPTCGNSLTTTLEDLGGTVSGAVQISNDGTNYYIKINETLAEYKIGQVKLIYGDEAHVRDRLLGLFFCGSQSPANPDMVVNYNPEQDEVLITIPIASIPGNCFYFHARITVVKRDPVTGVVYYSYDLWSNGTANASQNPCQEYFQYCRQECPPPPQAECGQLRTQTQGGWGTTPHGNNPGVYLHANFDNAFPNDLRVGCAGGYTITMTTAQAITNLLPTGGTPAKLKASATNPTNIKNVLVGQLISLTLNVRFDMYDANFGAAGVALGDMVIKSGPFANMTVNQFLVIANNVLGGCSTAYTPSQINDVASKINENYVDGKADNGYLVCPTTR